jgi:RNA polymerase subunit RPABC4/transcription elongation factor Spt4
MSSFRNIKITCPACNTEGSYTVWDSVNVDLDPELKVKVMDGSLFTWICPNCTVLEMTNGIWEFTERKHVISYDEYLRVCEKIK